MKTVIIYGERDVRVEDVDIPKIGPRDVLVRVRASGICGSDVHRYLATDYGRVIPHPMNSGHEYCGDVVEVGSDVRRFQVGDKGTLGVVWWALTGDLPPRFVDRPSVRALVAQPQGRLGAFSEYVCIPDADERLVKVPSHVSYNCAAVLEPFTVALKAFARPTITPDDSVLITGAGPIGLAALLLCHARGIKDVTVCEPSKVRRELAAKIGCKTVDPLEEDLAARIMDQTHGTGVDVFVECAGTQATLDRAFALTKHDGRILLIAHYRQTPKFNLERFVRGQRSLYPMGADDVTDEAIQLVADGTVDLAPLVSHEFPLEQAQRAFEVACDALTSVKVVFAP
ncbi:MAG: zinc-binding dehydrogenase [Chloroflexi bacterium]|nr:zinc-binding dehydrogenase [Chloroflexota bacterium]